MPLTKPLLTTTTALALMAGLAAPAAAQSLTDSTPRELLDAARDGELDLGFDTTTLSRDELLTEIVRARALCDSGTAPETLACDRIAQLPDPSGWLAAGEAEQDLSQDAPETAPAGTVQGFGDTKPLADEAAQAAADAAAQSTPPAEAPAETRSETPGDVAELADALAEDGAPPAVEADQAAPLAEAPVLMGTPGKNQREATPDSEQAEAAPAPDTDAAALADALAEETPEAERAEPAAEPAEPEAEPTEPATPQPVVTAEPEPEAAQPDDALQAAPLADADPASEPTSDQQADIAAQISAQGSGSAAASADGTDGAELIEEQLTDDNTRSSAEDFSTRIGNGDKKADKDDDGNDNLRTFGTAALLGLGAVALNQILGDDAKVVENSGDRIVVEQDGQYRVLRNDDVLLRQPRSDVKTYRFDDGSTRTVVTRQDGSEVVTIKAADGRVLRRERLLTNGETVVLFDDTQAETEVVINDLPQVVDAPTRRIQVDEVSEDELAAALAAESATPIGRRFSLNQIRNIDAVRHLVPEVSVDSINFETGSAAIRPEEARALSTLGNAMKRAIAQNPTEVFLIEGHTDATGGWGLNLALSDRRAESVALALTEYFDVPPENMVLQGYGESDLAIETQTSERQNRRAAVRRITPLLQGG